jgi:hypothetical protein
VISDQQEKQMVQENEPQESSSQVDKAVAEGGAYDIIRKRLLEQGKNLLEQTQGLNEARLAEFGSTDMSVESRVRVRTENNCIARDIVQVGNQLLFGYNVFIGMKKETQVEDVFALFHSKKTEQGFELEPVPLSQSFLANPSFVSDFDELYRYYKHTRLVELTLKDGKLLAGFQIGERLEDIRVFRWSVSADGTSVEYIDNRGERDIQLPSKYDFVWTETSREDIVNGRNPHVSILDTVFVETVGGDLTIKVENNTEDGLGIYREPVEDKTQSLDDADFAYAQVGGLILLKVRPYREDKWRYFVFNMMSKSVLRLDAIGESCVQLPEDHGIIFPGGYYLQSGENKRFDGFLSAKEGGVAALQFKRMIRSPNGEDVLYVFYEPGDGVVGLFAYNLIEKTLQNPIYGHGYALFEDGQLIIFSAEEEPTRVHPMQIWQTPYFSAEFASKAPVSQTFFGRIGNAELVRGVSDLYTICRAIDNQSVSSLLYEELSRNTAKIFDHHYWLDDTEMASLAVILRDITATAELVIDEFEKVESIRRQSSKAMKDAEIAQSEILGSIRPENWELAEEYVEALKTLRHQRGHLTSIREYRYIDLAAIETLNDELAQHEDALSLKTVTFLSADKALDPYLLKIDALNKDVEQAQTNAQLTPLLDAIAKTAEGLDLLSELIGTLEVDDATVRTRIIDTISDVYSRLNQSKATARLKQKNMGSEEAIAQFSAQFKLFSQSITNALGLATSPERCDEQLSRLLVQLEEMESQFSQFDQFLGDIMDKREEIYESFEAHKQQLLDERQRKAQSLSDAADRMLQSIEKRSLKYTQADELNTYLATDPLVLKVKGLIEQLRELESAIKADDIASRYKAITEQALRSLRDKSDIFEEGGNVIKLGPRHKFSVNTQELDLTIIPRDGALNIHLTGTNFYQPIDDPELLALKAYWDQSIPSETSDVYRAEYLAYLIIDTAKQGKSDLSPERLSQLVAEEKAGEGSLQKWVRDFASPRYKEGYQKGVHDHDAVLILTHLVPAADQADLLVYDPLARALAQVFWDTVEQEQRDDQSGLLSLCHKSWHDRAVSAAQMNALFSNRDGLDLLEGDVVKALSEFLRIYPICVEDSLLSEQTVKRAAAYLVAELSKDKPAFIRSQYALDLVESLQRSMSDDSWRAYQQALDRLADQPHARWSLSQAWLSAYLRSEQSHKTDDSLSGKINYIPEAIAIINVQHALDIRDSQATLELSVSGLLGEHATIQSQTLRFSVDTFLRRMEHHQVVSLPAYHRYLAVRQAIILRERQTLKIESFKARPLSSFVRNRLINESYLPLIGDNLAKQMGTLGENKRSDLMGLLMMISPPGYGKTTLMEYVANRLGLIFMKINCPSLGHGVLSLDPIQAPDATARQELEKLNLALEMGNNVMLYLDDIQHTHPEFLQKFISLCDGTRRIEGVWKGETKTYDMRGRKFCVVMAGNPYTESGEAFKIPDMLANRADIYNLGDILGGMDEQFALSYIENSLTSNPVLAPLALREMSDVYKLIDMANGKDLATGDLNHHYSGVEISEITGILRKMGEVQRVLLKINQQYIASAAQDDRYRTEPAFKLQGSYRNMNKMTEKISSVMNEAELQQMIADHYLGEAQLLTTGAESNLLKLGELRGTLNDEERQRWQQIKQDFMRNKAMGGDDTDVGGKVVAQLVDLVSGVKTLSEIANQQQASPIIDAELKADSSEVFEQNQKILQALEQLGRNLVIKSPDVNVVNQPVPGIDKVLTVLAQTIEHSIFPLVKSMDKKLDIDLRTHEKMKEISAQLRLLGADSQFENNG